MSDVEMNGLLMIAGFLMGMAFMKLLERLERPRMMPWGESTELWSDVDWAWYRRRKGQNYDYEI